MTRFALVVDPMITPKAKHRPQTIAQTEPLLLPLLLLPLLLLVLPPPVLLLRIFGARCALDDNVDDSKNAAAAPDPRVDMIRLFD